jgi:hypothetical protein
LDALVLQLDEAQRIRKEVERQRDDLLHAHAALAGTNPQTSPLRHAEPERIDGVVEELAQGYSHKHTHKHTHARTHTTHTHTHTHTHTYTHTHKHTACNVCPR